MPDRTPEAAAAPTEMPATAMPHPGGERSLSDADRQAIARIFGKRGRSELQVAATFAQITRELVEIGAEAVLLELAARAVADEVRHAKLWLEVASSYSGSAVEWPSASGPARIPTHPGAEPWLIPALHVVGMSCINETLASVRLRGCMEHTSDAQVQETLRSILTDEIHHARLGWAFMASRSVDSRTRAAISDWLVRLLDANMSALFADELEGSLTEGYPDHGIPSAARTLAIVTSGIHDVVLPGFARVGIDVTAARHWAETKLPSFVRETA